MRQFFTDVWHTAPNQLNVALFWILTRVLLWPDWELPWRCAAGFYIVGAIPDSNIFNPIDDPADGLVMPFLADSAQWHHHLANERLHDRSLDDVVHASTVIEIAKGYASDLCPQAKLDSIYGNLGWKAMRRRPFWQRGAGKWRMIDNGRTSGHNQASFMSETITTSSFDAPVQLLRGLRLTHGTLSGHLSPMIGS
eukprot:3908346-Amphidinium_carterae.1